MSDADGTGSGGHGLGRGRPWWRRFGSAVALSAAVAAAVALVVTGSAGSARFAGSGGPASDPAGAPSSTSPGPSGEPTQQLTLIAYHSCAAMLRALRAHAAAHVGAWGFPGSVDYAAGGARVAESAAAPAGPAADAAGSGAMAPSAGSAPDHSSTNDQEIGADEPDIVKNDGRQVVAVSGGILRVVDAATRTVTGTLDLRVYAGADGAQLLLAGDRVLVLLGGSVGYPAGPGDYPMGAAAAGPAVAPAATGGSTFLLVDIAARPTIVSTLRVDGGYVDARLIAGRARVVVDSTARIALPAGVSGSDSAQLAANRAAVRAAPLSAWQPTYQTSVGGAPMTPHSVPCERISHPKQYQGNSLTTVYTLDPATTLTDPHPVSVAADGTSVYASTTGLYIASADGTRTDVHRFDITGPGAPRYSGSGSVPGWLLNSYSMSEYAGTLRLVTTSGSSQETSLYVLDGGTLRRLGTVGGLGVGEQLHAVRFLGPLAYVVTFRSVDPLFVLDLHDPAHPRRAGELTVPGYSDYLHPTDDGRLLGVGQDVDAQQRVSGVRVSLFDVSRLTDPRPVDVVSRPQTPSETPIDPHAFLYWAPGRTAVVPLPSWQPEQSGAALVLHVDRDRLRVVGTIRNPGGTGYGTGIVRTLVIGSDLWTMSGAGLRVSDLGSLARRGWISFT